MLAATMMLFARGSASSASNDGNLIVDSELNPVAGRVPQGWSVSTIPECGFRYEIHPGADGMSEFEIINDAPVESVLQQSVHLEPGWYSFTADVKIETVGGDGAPPELFVRAATFAIEDRVHPLEWSDDWKQYRTVFRTGEHEKDFWVGCGLGVWGSPNNGRFLFRNPRLVAIANPQSVKQSSALQADEGYDMEGKIEARYFQTVAQAEAIEPPPTPKSSLLNERWSIFALYFGLLIGSMVGWRAVSPRRSA
jgi:hypothetical protein